MTDRPDTRMKIVLVTPEIPGNTGTIGRTCVALDLELILIRPYGFSIDEKAVHIFSIYFGDFSGEVTIHLSRSRRG